MTAGRPTLYREEFCDLICEMAAEGKSVSEWAAEIGVSRTSFYEWAQIHDEFSTAFARAKELEQAWFERKARENLENKNFNAPLWIKSAQARFRNDYTERREIESTGSVHYTGLPTPTVNQISFRVVDPAKLEIDQLEQLAGILESQSQVEKPLTIDHKPISEEE